MVTMDSIFLSMILCNVCKKFPIKVVSSYFNHGMMPFLNKPSFLHPIFTALALHPSLLAFVTKFLCFMFLQRLLTISSTPYGINPSPFPPSTAINHFTAAFIHVFGVGRSISDFLFDFIWLYLNSISLSMEAHTIYYSINTHSFIQVLFIGAATTRSWGNCVMHKFPIC